MNNIMKKYKLIANPHAGRGRAKKIIAETIGILNARGVAYDLAVTAGPGDAETIAARAFEQDEWKAVISIGGDGTLAIAHQLSRKGIPIVGVPKTID